MKSLLLGLSLLFCIQSKAALTIIPVSAFTNTPTLGTNWLFLITVPGVGNLNMTTLQLESFLANDPNFVRFMTNNSAYQFSGSSGGSQSPFVTNTPSICWTNFIAYWSTNASFAGSTSFVPSAYARASIVITNQANSNIVYTLPAPAYSLSLGTNVTSAIIGTNGVLKLDFLYLQGNTFVSDFGSDNRFLAQLAGFASSAHGLLLWTNNNFELH